MFEEPAYQWLDSGWRRSAEDWIHETAARQGSPVIRPITGVRFLPWSAVLRAPTSRGDLYFKACGPSQWHEPALAVLLAQAFPDRMIPVLAADLHHGRLLMPDGGPTLTAAIATPAAGPDHWRRVLALMSSIQHGMILQADRLLALGVPDRRPAALPGLYRGLLGQPDHLRAGAPGSLIADDLRDLESIAPRIDKLCAELAESGLPDTYVQDDLHEDHVFARRLPDGEWRYIFFDYGDVCVGHPFFQLVSRPRFAAGRYGIDGDRELSPLFKGYLLSWREFAPIQPLRRALDIALALGGVMRVMTWITACRDQLDALSPFLLDAYSTGVAFWLRQVRARVEGLGGS